MTRFVAVLAILAIVATPLFAAFSDSDNDTVIQYATFENHPVELVIHQDENMSSVTVRVRGYEGHTVGDRTDRTIFDFLKTEAARLSSGSGPIALGTTGYTFELKSGMANISSYSEWETHATSLYAHRFAENVVRSGKNISAKGPRTIPKDYQLSKR